MDVDPVQETLIGYLQQSREVMLWKLEGLDEYQVRAPRTPTGTNLLGIVRHLATVELGYFGDCLGRPHGLDLPWAAPDAEPNADLWVPADQSRADVVGLYHTAWAHSAETFAACGRDAPAEVPWWGRQRHTTLGRLLVHMVNETARHAGQADIVRELIDGAVGHRRDVSNLGDETAADYARHVARLEANALEARRRWG